MIPILIMNTCFAFALPLLKLAITDMNPLLVVTIRMTLAGLLILMYTGMLRKPFSSQNINLRLTLLTAFVAIYGVCVGEALALETMSAAKASIMWALLPLITALLGHIIKKERLNRAQWFALALGTAGMFILIGGTEQGSLSTSLMTHWTREDILMSLAVLCAGYGYFLLRDMLATGHGILETAGTTMYLGGVMSGITLFITNGTRAFTTAIWWPALGYIALVILLVNFIGLLLQNWLIQRYSVTLLALSSFITPITGVLLSIGWLGEQWYSYYGIAGSCIGAALWLMYVNEPSR